MAIESKNHRDDRVNSVTTSAASRDMARPATLKFADHEQELQHWVAVKTEIQGELQRMRAGHADELRRISASTSDGSVFFRKKSAAELDYEYQRRSVLARLADVESGIQSVKLRIKQARLRADTLSRQNRESTSAAMSPSNRDWAKREDGALDYGIIFLAVLDEIRGLRADLAAMRKSQPET